MTDGQQNFGPITALGLMSGTSLDGLDMALCRFECNEGKWSVEWLSTRFTAYSVDWRNKLIDSYSKPISESNNLHRDYGRWIAAQVNDFLTKNDRPNLICSHGHTVKHEPDKGITFQLGDGETIASETGIRTIADFRAMDVSLGGQGAPLVPIGDRLLFSEFDACLNLGGFSNISFDESNRRVAFDICPVNIVLNELAKELAHEFDRGGELARSGNLDGGLLYSLLHLSTEIQDSRISLSREWIENHLEPALNGEIATTSKLRTVTEYAAYMISQAIQNHNLKEVLITGGGAYNTFLLERVSSLSEIKINQASDQLIDFKEAMVFAFLGVLRWYGQINVLASVTGAQEDCVSGEIFNV